MVTAREVLEAVPDRFLLAAAVLLIGTVLAVLVARLNRRLLERAGVPEVIEGTAFERTAQGFGTSTIAIVATLSMYFLVGFSLLVALTIADIRFTRQFWSNAVEIVPQVFVAALILIIGVILGDKVEIALGERFDEVKLPQLGVVPAIGKYSVIYVATLVALGQVGVATGALLIMLGVYVFGAVFLAGLALRDVLASAAAGVYLLLNQPYAIGDDVRIGDCEGIVQEVDVLTTRVEGDGEEYVLPNSRVFSEGVVRRR